MTSNIDNTAAPTQPTVADTWRLNALTAALGDLTLTVSDSLSVGRGSDNDVVLGSKEVSRNHAVLSVLNGKLYVKDLDSSNGTFINEQRIDGNKSKHLEANDTLGFASFAFTVTPVTVVDEAVEQPVVAEEPTAEVEPVVKQTMVTDVLPSANDSDSAPVKQADIAESKTDKANEADVPVVKETIIKEVLAAKDTVDTTPVQAAPVAAAALDEPTPTTKEENIMAKETMTKTPSTEKPLATEKQPLTKQPTVEQQSLDSVEHDKTTRTELQEEADPDVLRAKQAATAQFSGTANLGQARDLGTKGNNAMDQAINNPANAGYVEKKPSGGWFIWVFAVILIIGLALWLFNMGGI